MWITLNEPWVTSICGYGEGDHAPGVKGIGESVYVAAHNQELHFKYFNRNMSSRRFTVSENKINPAIKWQLLRHLAPTQTMQSLTRNQIRAHAKAYRLYQRQFAATQNGKVGITLNIDWAEPVNPKDGNHLEASDRAIQFHLGWFAHPIFINGAYPVVMREKV